MFPNNHDFIIGPSDTDSISFCKPDMSPFSEEEQKLLLQELNDISPDFMEWEDDGYYQSCIALRAKNYVLYDGKKKTVKGSAFKTSSKEIALKEFMEELVDAMILDKMGDLVGIYTKYIKEALNVQDIHRWCQKKTITESVIDSANGGRKNETDVWDAIKNEDDRQQGNKVFLYPVILGTHTIPGGVSKKTGKPLKDKVKEITGLRMDKYWNNDHDVEKLVERVVATLQIFELVLDMDQFIDYSTKKNKSLLEELKNENI